MLCNTQLSLLFFFSMLLRPPISTLTDTLFAYTSLFRSPATGNPFSWPRRSAFPYAETLRPGCMPFVPAMEGIRRQRPHYVVFIHTSNRTIRAAGRREV